MPNTLNQITMNVPKGRRITLPKFFNIKEGEPIIIQELEDGGIKISHDSNDNRDSSDDMITIYGVVIGADKAHTWWGIFCDKNGNIFARVCSSSQYYLLQDLSIPTVRDKKKLDNKCGVGLWMQPEIINWTEEIIPGGIACIRMQLFIELTNGTWPPKR